MKSIHSLIVMLVIFASFYLNVKMLNILLLLQG